MYYINKNQKKRQTHGPLREECIILTLRSFLSSAIAIFCTPQNGGVQKKLRSACFLFLFIKIKRFDALRRSGVLARTLTTFGLVTPLACKKKKILKV
jgi:hypothetical protein